MKRIFLSFLIATVLSFASNFTVDAQILIKDIYPGSSGSGIDDGAIIGSKLFFTASDGSSELWVSDREIDSTYIIGPTLPGVDQSVSNTALYHVFRDSLLVFTNTINYDMNIYATSGTLERTQFIKTIPSGRSIIYGFVEYNNKLYFPGYDAVHRTELWESDGTESGTQHVLNTFSGDPAPSPINFKTYNDRLWFTSYGQPWYVDGASLVLADSYYPNTTDASLELFTSSDSEPAFFIQPYNNELNKRLVKVNPDASMETLYSTLKKNTQLVAYKNQKLFFTETATEVYPYTLKIKNLNVNTGDTTLLISYTTEYSTYGTTGYIQDNDNIFLSLRRANGWELWSSDGSPSGTNKIDFTAGVKISFINFIKDEKAGGNLEASGKIFFNASINNGDTYMWMSDGTVSGTERLEFEGQPLIFSTFLHYANGVIFPAYHPLYGTELFYTDGTSAGTKLLTELVPGSSSGSPYMLGIISDTLFVRANLGTDYGSELYALPINFCEDITCPDGYTCVYGECIEMDPCADAICAAGSVCYQGGCFPSCAEGSCIELGPNLAAGHNATIQLDAGSGFDVYEWSTGEVEQKIKVKTSGKYWVTAYNLGGTFFGTDTVSLIFKCDPQGACPEGFACSEGYCINTAACANVDCEIGESCWEGGCLPTCSPSENPEFCHFGLNFDPAPCSKITCPDGFVCDGGNCRPIDPCADAICPEGHLCHQGGCFANCDEGDTGICLDLGPNLSAGYNATIQLDAGSGFDVYEWSTGEVEQKIKVKTSGKYWVTAYNLGGTFFGTDTVSLIFKCDPQGACPEGFACSEGYCINTAACANVDCEIGESCWEGGCLPTCSPSENPEFCHFGLNFDPSPCASVICPKGYICDEGDCIPKDPCADAICPEGHLCHQGGCYANCNEGDTGICLDLGPNLAAGHNAAIQLDAGSGFDVYEWSTGEVEQKIKVNRSGRYWVTAYNLTDEFFGTDTVSVIFKCDPQGACPEGFACVDGYCINTDACFDAICPEGSVCYEGGCFPSCDNNSTADVCFQGQEFANASCEDLTCSAGDVCFEGGCFPAVDDPCADATCAVGQVCHEGGCFTSCEEGDTGICLDLGPNLAAGHSTTLILDAGSGFDIYEWSTGETTQTVLVDKTGRYWVIAYNLTDNTYSSDTISVIFECNPQGECPEGFGCVDGYCINTDACIDVICPEGSVCYQGGCFPACGENDNTGICYSGQEYVAPTCENVICQAGSSCYQGGCYEDPCADLICAEGDACVYGSCYTAMIDNGDINMQGDVAEGADGNTGGRLTAAGQPLENINIVLFDEAKTGYYAMAVSDSEGKFEFLNLNARTYKVFINSYPYIIRGNDLIQLTNANAKYNLQITLVDGAWEIKLNVLTGFSENSIITSGLSVYPNPTRSSLYYKSTSDIGKAELRIYNTLGGLVKQRHIEIGAGDRNLIYEFGSGQKGVYLVQITKDGQTLLSSKVLIVGD